MSRDAVLHAALERLADDLDTDAGRYIGTPLGLTFGMLADRLRFIWRAALTEADSAIPAEPAMSVAMSDADEGPA